MVEIVEIELEYNMCSNEKQDIVYIVCINVMHRVYDVAAGTEKAEPHISKLLCHFFYSFTLSIL